MNAFGIGGYPGFVAIGADGKVRKRATGSIGVEGYRALISAAAS